MSEADALSLTNRLKRQQIRGADVNHLSRSTVSNILAELTGLRAQFRGLLEDEKSVTTCGRKELRALFKLFKDVFTEMGEMRVTLNEVMLDPGVAQKISEAVMHPKSTNTGEASEAAAGGGWMAPISKLFSSPSGAGKADGGLNRSTSTTRRAPGPPPRVVPKLGPALSASTTTVNVEFTGSGVGRAVTSSTTTTIAAPIPVRAAIPQISGGASGPSSVASPGVMGIFAGAPRVVTPNRESWVVVPVPKASRETPSSAALLSPDSARLIRGGWNHPNRLSRNVDAVIDVGRTSSQSNKGDVDEDEPDYVGPLLQRTLRRRGMSDSSIHSTFASQEEPASPSAVTAGNGVPSPRESAWLDKGSVLQALTRRMQNFRLGTSADSVPGTSPPQASVGDHRQRGQEAVKSSSSTGFGILPTLSSWAAASEGMTDNEQSSFFAGGGVRDEGAFLERTRSPGHVYGFGGRR